MEPIRIFYSWQSDRDLNVCRRFIQLALQGALDRPRPDLEQHSLLLDSDTAGIAGTPPVSETILRKIRTCDIFVGDVSFVGATPKGKLLPNPNVMTEFGYARSVLDDQQLLLVMNTAFGPERDLPFDLAHLRHPLAYTLAEGASDGARRSARAAFAHRLVGPLAASIRFVLKARRTRPPTVDALGPANGLLARAEFPDASRDMPAIVNGPRLLLRVASATAADEPYLEPVHVKGARRLFIPHGYERCVDEVDSRQWSTFDPPQPRGDRHNPEARWLTRLLRPGIVESVIMIGARIDDDTTIVVEGFPLESRIVDAARRSAEILKQIGLDGPLAISASLLGLENVQVSTPHRLSRPLGIPSMHLGQVGALSPAAVTPVLLRSFLDAFWLGAGYDEGTPSFANGAWKGEAGGTLYEPVTIGRRAWR